MKRGGLFDWWAQRISAILISAFALPVLVAWFGGFLVDSVDWYLFLSSWQMRSLACTWLVGYLFHAGLGLGVVVTDYIPRQFQQVSLILVHVILAAHFIAGLYLVWVF